MLQWLVWIIVCVCVFVCERHGMKCVPSLTSLSLHKVPPAEILHVIVHINDQDPLHPPFVLPEMLSLAVVFI